MKKLDILDFTNHTLCIMVVAIHTELFPMVLYPWLRLAVPLFFVISSFLLYSKINNSPYEDRKKIVNHYVLRLLKYYLLHVSIARIINSCLDMFITNYLLSVFLNYLFTILCCVLIFILIKKLENKCSILRYSH